MEKPIYRGTREELEAKASEAKQWFLSQISIAIKSLPAEQQRRIYQELELKERVFVEQGVSACATQHTLNEYFYEWRTGLKPVSNYTPQKFLLRKDGTVNITNLTASLGKWAVNTLSKELKASVLKSNKEVYAQANEPKHDAAKITLSQSVLGKASIEFLICSGDKEIKLKKRSVSITMIQGTLNKMDSIAKAFLA